LQIKHAAGALAISGLLAWGAVGLALAQDTQPAKPRAADNTKVNQRDRSKTEPTADQAKNNTSDRDLMQKIRRSIMDEKSLSSYAHNVKIVAQHGKVTLKGPVRSEEEKRTVEQKATDVAGAGNVTNEITIKPGKKTS
jgi:osmotically-inducible protein OsmY